MGELIRRKLSEILARGEIHDPDLNRIPITVGEVAVTGDLRIATAYVMPLGGEGRDEMLELLNRNRSELRRAVSKGLTLKNSPELRFAIDETFDRLDTARRMFSDDRVRRDLDANEADDDRDEDDGDWDEPDDDEGGDGDANADGGR